MKEELVALVLQLREEMFKKMETPPYYNDQRDLEYTPNIGPGYNEILPTFDSLSLIDIINRKISNSLHDKPLKILDLGCGPTARTLRTCKKRWEKSIECFGINTTLPTDPAIQQEIQQLEIHLESQDVHNIHSIYSDKSMDLIIACKLFPYLVDPYTALIGINKVLADNGIALISDFPLSPLIEGMDENDLLKEKFISFLTSRGIEVDSYDSLSTYKCTSFCTLAFSKIENMTLPLTHSGRYKDINIKLPNGPYSFEALTYKIHPHFCSPA